MNEHTESDAGRVNPFLRIEDTTWPSPLDPNETAWQLIYGQPSRKDLMFAASVMSAYGYLFEMNQRDRNRRIEQIKASATPPGVDQ
jgi:hypothetical protein